MAFTGLPQGAESDDADRAALRVQVAAVAAQQAELDEQEARLAQRRSALRQQEEQLAQSNQRSLAERTALEADRADFQAHVAKVTAELGEHQKEMRQARQTLLAERQRLERVAQKLRQRWREQFADRKQRLKRQEELLGERTQTLDQARLDLRRQHAELGEELVRFNSQRELESRMLQDGLETLERDQRLWRERRGKERAALKVRQRDVEAAERSLTDARRLLAREKIVWEAQRRTLEEELHGLNNRVVHQRQKLREKQEEARRLEDATHPLSADAPATVSLITQSSDDQAAILEKLAGELADQRALLIEQWERLARVRQSWLDERDQAATDLEALAVEAAQQEQELRRREQTHDADAARLQKHWAELEQRRHEVLVARARLHAQEQAWEGERQHLLGLTQTQVAQTEQRLASLDALRHEWLGQRQENQDAAHAERDELEQSRYALTQARVELQQQRTQLEEEKSRLAEQALALEQYRHEVAGDGADDLRLERLRRRWLVQHEALVRLTRDERESLRVEMQAVERRRADVVRRAEQLSQTEAELEERQILLDHREALLATRQLRWEHEVRAAEAQRRLAEQRLLIAKDEAERLASALWNDEEPPLLERAA
jgi:hypothetical protein